MILHTPLNKVPIKPMYMIHGYDFQQTIQVAKKIKGYFANVKKYYFIDFSEFLTFYKSNKAQLLTKDLFCQSSINNLIEISVGNAKFSKSQIIELNDLLGELLDIKIILILVAEKLDQMTLKSAWLKVVNEIGVIICTKPLSKYFMLNWVRDQFKKFNITITEEALLKFYEVHHNNLLLSEQNIFKLSMIFTNDNGNSKNYHADQILTLEYLLKQMHWLGQEKKITIFDLQNAITLENKSLILHIVKYLQDSSKENLLFLWGIIELIKEKLNHLFNEKNNSKIEQGIKLAILLEKAAEIDLILKGVDSLNEYSLQKNSNDYICSLLLDLCLNTASVINQATIPSSLSIQN